MLVERVEVPSNHELLYYHKIWSYKQISQLKIKTWEEISQGFVGIIKAQSYTKYKICSNIEREYDGFGAVSTEQAF